MEHVQIREPTRSDTGPGIAAGTWQPLRLTFLAFLFALPFLWPMHNLPLTTFDAEWVSSILLCVVLISMAKLAGISARVQWPFPALLIGLGAFTGLQYVSNRLDYAYSFLGLLIFCLTMVVSYILGRHLAASSDRELAVKAICIGLVVGSGLSVVLQLLQALSVVGVPEYLMTPFSRGSGYGRPYANLAQPNLLALYLVLGLLGAAYLSRTGSPSVLVRVMSFWLALGVALTMSRVGVLLLCLFVAFVLIPTGLKSRRQTDRWLVLTLVVLGYACGTVISKMLLFDTADGVDSALGRISESSIRSRLVMWSDAVDVIATAPWLGTGFGEYAKVHYWTASANDALIATSNVHNLPLQMAADFGVLAPILLALYCGWWILSGFGDRIQEPIVALAMAALAAVGLHSMFEWPLWHLYFAVPTAVFIGLAEPELARGTSVLRSRLVLPLVGLAGLASASIMKADADSINGITDRVLAERVIRQGFSFETLSDLLAATNGSFFQPYAERVLVQLGPQPERPDDYYIAMSERVLLRLPSPQLIERHISNLYRAGEVDEAIRHVNRLRVFSRGNFSDHQEVLLQEISSEDVSGVRLKRALKSEDP